MENPNAINRFEKREELITKPIKLADYWQYGKVLREQIQQLEKIVKAPLNPTIKFYGAGIQPFFINSLEITNKILPSLDEDNKLIINLPENQLEGEIPFTHPVTHFNEVFYKWIAVYPAGTRLDIDISMEFHVNAWMFHLSRSGKAATTTFIVVEQKTSEGGWRRYYGQASRAIGQEDFDKYYRQHKSQFKDINFNNYTEIYVTNLIVPQQDGKLDNIRVDNSDLIPIDSDKSGDCLVDSKPAMNFNNTFSAILLLPQQYEFVSNNFCNYFLQHSPEFMLLRNLWDQQIFYQYFQTDVEKYIEFSSEEVIEHPTILRLGLVKRGLMDYELLMIRKMQEALRSYQEQPLTHNELFRRVQPLTYYYYEAAKRLWLILEWLIALTKQDPAAQMFGKQLNLQDNSELNKSIELLVNELQAVSLSSDSPFIHKQYLKQLHKKNLFSLLKDLQFYFTEKISDWQNHLDIHEIYKQYMHLYPSKTFSLENALLFLGLEQNEDLQKILKETLQFQVQSQWDDMKWMSIGEVIADFVKKIDFTQIPLVQQPELAELILEIYQENFGLSLPNGMAPLHLAVITTNETLINNFIAKNKDWLTTKNSQGKTVLDIAYQNKNSFVIAYLIEIGVHLCLDPLAIIRHYENYRLNNPPKDYLGSVEELKIAIRLLPIYQYPDKNTGKRPITEIEEEEWTVMLMAMMIPFSEKALQEAKVDDNNNPTLIYVVHGNIPGDHKKFILNPEITKVLLNDTKFNDSLTKKRKRTSVPIKSTDYDTFIKIYPQAPGCEFRIYQLSQFFGASIAPSTLFKLCVYDQEGRVIKTAPIIISKTVPGGTLEKLLGKPDACEILKRLHPQSYTQLILMAGHAKFGDARGRNLGVEAFHDLNNKKWIRIKGFDNDHNLELLFNKQEDYSTTNVKFQPFIFDQMLEKVNYTHLDEYFATDFKKVFSLLVQKFNEFQKFYIGNCFSYQEIERYQSTSNQFLSIGEKPEITQLLLLLEDTVIDDLYVEMQYVQDQLRIYKSQNVIIDHLDIIAEISARLAYIHRVAIDRSASPETRFATVIGEKNPSKSTVTTFNVPKASTLVSKTKTPITSGLILSEFKTKMPIFDAAKCENRLERIYKHYPDIVKGILKSTLDQSFNDVLEHFKNLSDSGKELVLNVVFPALAQDTSDQNNSKQAMLLDTLAGGSYRRLNLSNSSVLTNEKLQRILQNCYDLVELNLSGCQKLQQKMNAFTTLAELIEKYGQLLKKLDLSNTKIESFTSLFGNALTLPKLKELNLSFCQNLSAIKVDSSGQKLERLNLNQCPQLKTVMIDPLQLLELNLVGCTTLEYKDFLQKYPFFLGLDLSTCGASFMGYVNEGLDSALKCVTMLTSSFKLVLREGLQNFLEVQDKIIIPTLIEFYLKHNKIHALRSLLQLGRDLPEINRLHQELMQKIEKISKQDGQKEIIELLNLNNSDYIPYYLSENLVKVLTTNPSIYLDITHLLIKLDHSELEPLIEKLVDEWQFGHDELFTVNYKARIEVILKYFANANEETFYFIERKLFPILGLSSSYSSRDEYYQKLLKKIDPGKKKKRYLVESFPKPKYDRFFDVRKSKIRSHIFRAFHNKDFYSKSDSDPVAMDILELLFKKKIGEINLFTIKNLGDIFGLAYSRSDNYFKILFEEALATSKSNLLSRSMQQLKRIVKEDNEKEFKKLIPIDLLLQQIRDSSGQTLLHLAVEYGAEKIIKEILLMPNVDIEVENEEGKSPLWLAFIFERYSIAMLLLEQYVKSDREYKGCYESRQYMIKSAIKHSDVPLIIYLLQITFGSVGCLCPALGPPDYELHNLSWFAYTHCQNVLPIFHLLYYLTHVVGQFFQTESCSKTIGLHSKREIIDPTLSLLSLLELSIKFFDLEKNVKYYLIAIEILIKSKVYQKMPLHLAVEKNVPIEIISCMLEHKADVNNIDNSGNTPLHAAAQLGYEDKVRILLKHSANVDIRNKNGKTAAEIALTPEIANFILTYKNPQKSLSNEFSADPIEKQQSIVVQSTSVASFSQTFTSRFFKPADNMDSDNQIHKSLKEEELNDDEEALEFKKKPPSPSE